MLTRPTHLDFILRQIESASGVKFAFPLHFTGQFTSAQLSEITEKWAATEEKWRANLSFAEFKEHEERFKDCKWYTPPAEHELPAAFERYKAAGLRLEVVLAFNTKKDPDTIRFITSHIRSGRISSLTFLQNFSEQQMDDILSACQTSEVQYLHFYNEEQQITEKQATLIYYCLLYKLKSLTNLPGRHISDETAGKLASIAARIPQNTPYHIMVKNSAFFEERYAIEKDIHDCPSPLMGRLFVHYTSDDIKRLRSALTIKYNKSRPKTFSLHLLLSTTLQNPEWITFFTELFNTVNLGELSINESSISHSILMTIVTALGTSHTLKKLFLHLLIEDNDDQIDINKTLVASLKLNSSLTSLEIIGNYRFGDEIIHALIDHPALTSLIIKYFFFDFMKSTENPTLLLTHTKTLRHFALTDCRYGDIFICELARGLENNTTLTSLSVSRLTNQEMCLLAPVISLHPSLTALTFDNSFMNREIAAIPRSTVDGLYKFVRLLKNSRYLKKIDFEWPEEKNAANTTHRQLLHQITENNKEKWIIDKRQPYVHAVILLFQAARTNHKLFSTLTYCNAILSFLEPEADTATPGQVERCTQLLRENLLQPAKRRGKWKAHFFAHTGIKNMSGEKQIKKYTVFEKWPEHKENKLTQNTQAAPVYLTTNSLLDPDNVMRFDYFQRVLDTYESRSLLNWCCCFSGESTTMQKFRRIQPNEEKQVTRAQVEKILSEDSQRRLDFFNDKPNTVKGSKGTDEVITLLKTYFNY